MGNTALDVVSSKLPGLIDSVERYEPLDNSDHNQVYYNINLMTDWHLDIPEEEFYEG